MQDFASAHQLWSPHTRILVAVSGGPDSVCLMDILAFLAQKQGFSLAIAHVNYQLRGSDSLEDERFVRSLASQYAVPCFIKRYPRSTKKHDEQAMRDFRYAFFKSLCDQHAFVNVALGHQKCDQAETFLMNLLRGSGPIGLSVMLPKHTLYIRPLLTLDRADILQYLHVRSLSFRTDASNADIRYTRNRIRHELIPLLKERFNTNIISTLANSATIFQEYAAREQSPEQLCPVTIHNHTARFTQLNFLNLSEQEKGVFLYHLIRTLSTGQRKPRYTHIRELTKAICSTKNTSTSTTIGALKLTRKGDTVLLLYSPL